MGLREGGISNERNDSNSASIVRKDSLNCKIRVEGREINLLKRSKKLSIGASQIFRCVSCGSDAMIEERAGVEGPRRERGLRR
jgi:hypothetical protein